MLQSLTSTTFVCLPLNKIILAISEDLQFTIITVCKNSATFLEETIMSVIEQTYPNIQYIVIDGGSTDGTIDIIKRYSAKINYWISEPDSGMYYAINKALLQATGDYILILNSDDVLVDSITIKNAADVMAKDKLDFYHGNMVKLKDGRMKKVKLFPVTFKQLLFSTHCTFAPHPCFFISAHLNEALEGYKEEYKYASDYDYILRALRKKTSKGKHLDMFISNFRIHENSISASGKISEERKKILVKYGYYQKSFLIRFSYYYILWMYYKIINLGHSYKAG